MPKAPGRKRNDVYGRPLSKKSTQCYHVPRDPDGRPVEWVIELAQLRAAGHVNVQWLASRLLVHISRIYQVMRAPDYPQLELMEGLAMLERRRPRALVALADRADRGDPAAVRLLLEITGVLEPVRPVLVTLRGLTRGAAPEPGAVPRVGQLDTPEALAAAREKLYRDILHQEPVDVLFRQLEAPAQAAGNGHGAGHSNGHNGHNGNGHNGHGGENGTTD